MFEMSCSKEINTMKLKLQLAFITLLLGLVGCEGEKGTVEKLPIEKPAVEKTAAEKPAIEKPTIEQAESNVEELEEIINLPEEDFVEETPNNVPQDEEIIEIVNDDSLVELPEDVGEEGVSDEENEPMPEE
ncbi:hypothetical protein THIOM_003663 [Candidatus Thiomargarita nelsonii]|uniref:Uncharacterized protein n=1 Tax=Candidatus Thiomargarita nelsonii TaxID=1003181 RepID=A0A176RXZ1_9GAMM|nr:hypothetical protein THIOM_003663 [Candidatus Thiomargarita nelsonii]